MLLDLRGLPAGAAVIPVAQRYVYICFPCWRAIDPKAGRATTASALAAAEAHGCLLHRAPEGRAARRYQKFALPRAGTPEEWGVIWDSLDSRKLPSVPCRRGCGHAEAAHQFSTLIQDDCSLNCPSCAGRNS